MVAFNQTFNPGKVPEDERSFDLLPGGDYDLQFIEAPIEPCNGGEMLKLTMEVQSGPHANRRLWENLCIVHSNPQTQQIAQRTLADICILLGITALRDTDELLFKPFKARVGIRKASQKDIDAGYPDDKNQVRFKTRGVAGAAAAQNKPASGGGGSNRPPTQRTAQAPARPWGAGGATKPAAQPATTAQRNTLDDEIPF